jgi:hypothetical protein
MKQFVASISIDGNQVKGSDYFYDYPFISNIDFEKDELSIHRNWKMNLPDKNKQICTIAYADIIAADLKIIKRIYGTRISLVGAYYDFLLTIQTDNQKYEIETRAFFQLKSGLERIQNFVDIVDPIHVFSIFTSEKQFFDLTDQEEKCKIHTVYHDSRLRNDFQNYCGKNYDDWVRNFGFEKGRIVFPKR